MCQNIAECVWFIKRADVIKKREKKIVLAVSYISEHPELSNVPQSASGLDIWA